MAMVEYKKMAEVLDNRENGAFRLDKFTITEKNRPWRDPIPCGDYVRLLGNGECVMSDTPMEKRTNYEFIHNAHGDVFIAGLGIGLIVLPIQEKAEVKSITILEKNQEVIDMVAPQLPFNDKIKIIQGNVFDYAFPKGTKFDCLYFDIWNYVNSEVYNKQMKPLKRKYLKYKKKKDENPNAFIKCWAEWQAKNDRPLF